MAIVKTNSHLCLNLYIFGINVITFGFTTSWTFAGLRSSQKPAWKLTTSVLAIHLDQILIL